MDARPEFPMVSESPPSRSFIDQTELRSILSSLSHELCRPLISLRAGFDLLLGDSNRPISTDQRRHVQTMAGLCDDLLRLTRSYLDYAGLVQGARPLCLGAFTVAAMTREIDREFGPIARRREIQWECVLDGPDATVTTDAARCQQIFGNLVANALKYTPTDGRVRVSGGIDGPSWRVTVTDNGPGIPAEETERVFAPFYRLTRDEKSRVEGNGLGLAICRELVDQLGGSISLESELGVGTRVTVRLPLDSTRRADEGRPGPSG